RKLRFLPVRLQSNYQAVCTAAPSSTRGQTVIRRAGLFAAVFALLVSSGGPSSAQAIMARRAASPAALLAFPGFFQAQPVVVRGTLATRDQPVLLSPTAERAIPLIFNGPSPPDGPVDLRATFWDVGRFQ